MTPAEVSLPNETDVLVVRDFAAPAALVWRAYTEPELMQKWLCGPPGWAMTVCEMDVRVGGAYRWRWRNDGDGSEFGFTGKFLDVVADTRLSETQLFDPGTLGGDMGEECVVTQRFTGSPGGTRVETLILYQSRADRDAALATGMTDGMEQSYTALDRLIAAGEA